MGEASKLKKVAAEPWDGTFTDFPQLPWRKQVPADLRRQLAADAEKLVRGEWALFGWKAVEVGAPPCWHRDPTLGVVKLQSARLNVSGATITRHLLVELIGVPTLEVKTAKPSGIDESGAYAGHSGYIVYRARAQTVYPYWIGSALLTQDTAPATAELAISGSNDTVVINNASRRWVGLRVVFGSVSGTVTSVTITNSANSDSLVITHPTGFANGDVLDFLATDPRKIARTNARFGGGTYRMRLETGSQTLTGARTAGTGTCTLTLSWPELHLTN
jgi:hypothetical protein